MAHRALSYLARVVDVRAKSTSVAGSRLDWGPSSLSSLATVSHPTILLIGASGLLGRAVAASLFREASLTLVATIRNPDTAGARQLALPPENVARLDVLDQPALERLFDTCRPAAVIMCAAERRPDVCERDPAAARAINVDAPARIGARATARGRSASPPTTCSTARPHRTARTRRRTR